MHCVSEFSLNKSYVNIPITCDDDDNVPVDGHCNVTANGKMFTTMIYDMTDFILTFVFVGVSS